MYLFFMHLIAVGYPQRIHRSAKLLLQVSMRITTFTVPHLKYQTRLALSIEKLHTRNRYGITYGKLQLVTMATFVKVIIHKLPRVDANAVRAFQSIQFLMFYNKFMIFSYKLNKANMGDQ